MRRAIVFMLKLVGRTPAALETEISTNNSRSPNKKSPPLPEGVPNDLVTDSPFLYWNSETEPEGTPAIFFSPHQDDETIGMAASISETSRNNRPVYVVLLTNGHHESLRKQMINLGGHENYALNDVFNARNAEMKAACMVLGVHRIYIANHGKGFDEVACYGLQAEEAMNTLQTSFEGTMNYFIQLWPNAGYRTVSGEHDSQCGRPTCVKTPAHQCASRALHRLHTTNPVFGKNKDLLFYRIYAYYGHPSLTSNPPGCDKNPSWYRPIDERDRKRKENAHLEYYLMDPRIGRYGLGFFSVPPLFINSLVSPFEYIDFVEDVI
jgi:hypothetical protein